MKKIITALLMFSILLFLPTPVNAAPKLNKTSVVISKGKNYRLKIKKNREKAKWSSKNKKVATVSASGKITGRKKGTTYIYAKIGKRQYKCKVKVEVPVLSTTKHDVFVGKHYTLKLNNCSRVKKFSSSNNSIATVSQKGVITGKRKGTAKIVVKISDNTYYCTIIVKNKPSSRIPSGTQDDPKDAYTSFTSDLYDNANFLGNFSITLLDFQTGNNITGIIPITKLEKDKYDPDKYEYLYLKFQTKYNYGKDIISAHNLFLNKDVFTDRYLYYYDFYDINFNNHMKDWVRSPSYYDSCSNIYDTKLSPGDTKIYSLLMIIPKNQLLLGYRLQTGVNIGTHGEGFYTFTYFTAKKK